MSRDSDLLFGPPCRHQYPLGSLAFPLLLFYETTTDPGVHRGELRFNLSLRVRIFYGVFAQEYCSFSLNLTFSTGKR